MDTHEQARAGADIDLAALIRDVPDFPQRGVLFKDITRAFSSFHVRCRVAGRHGG